MKLGCDYRADINIFAMVAAFLLCWSGMAYGQTAESNPEELAPPKPEDWGMPAHGGEEIESAELLELNMDYRLKSPIVPGQERYFKIELEPSLAITAAMRYRPTAKEEDCRVGVEAVTLDLLDPSNELLDQIRLEDFGSWVRSVEYRSAVGGMYYARLASESESIPTDCLQFKLSGIPISGGDLGTANDAGSEPALALPIGFDEYENNHLGGIDMKDSFAFEALEDEQYLFLVEFSEPAPAVITIRLLDENLETLLSERFESPTWSSTSAFEIPQDGDYIIEVSLDEVSPQIYPYSFHLTLVEDKQAQR